MSTLDFNAPWPEAPASHTLSSDEMLGVLELAGINPDAIELSDDEYALPTLNWITGDFADSMTGFLNSLEFTYELHSQDCKAFSRAAAFWAEYCWNKTQAGQAALALGQCYYLPNGSMEGHAINCAMTRKAGKIALVFFEPQLNFKAGFNLSLTSMTEKNLEPCEIESCSLLLF
ncbi:MAG: hypothetical protein JWR19_2160 [Pedosphaera sp.]|nr:hypothetical protein [Pedosphaera sp.]